LKLTCKQATELVSQGLDRDLAFGERARLRLHLLICNGCRATRQHFDFLRRMTAAYEASLEEGQPKPDR
jgi:hypothetical protein